MFWPVEWPQRAQPEAVPAGQLACSWSTQYSPVLLTLQGTQAKLSPGSPEGNFCLRVSRKRENYPSSPPWIQAPYWMTPLVVWRKKQFTFSSLQNAMMCVPIGLAWWMPPGEFHPGKCLTEFVVPTYREVRKTNSNYQVFRPPTLQSYADSGFLDLKIFPYFYQ